MQGIRTELRSIEQLCVFNTVQRPTWLSEPFLKYFSGGLQSVFHRQSCHSDSVGFCRVVSVRINTNSCRGCILGRKKKNQPHIQDLKFSSFLDSKPLSLFFFHKVYTEVTFNKHNIWKHLKVSIKYTELLCFRGYHIQSQPLSSLERQLNL